MPLPFQFTALHPCSPSRTNKDYPYRHRDEPGKGHLGAILRYKMSKKGSGFCRDWFLHRQGDLKRRITRENITLNRFGILPKFNLGYSCLRNQGGMIY